MTEEHQSGHGQGSAFDEGTGTAFGIERKRLAGKKTAERVNIDEGHVTLQGKNYLNNNSYLESSNFLARLQDQAFTSVK